MGNAEEEYQVRFRHVHGDIGPLTMPTKSTVDTLKQQAFQEWPEEGPLASFKPTSPEDIRLISSGKFLESPQTLIAIAKGFGEITPDFVLTLHVIVRPPGSAKAVAPKDKAEVDKSCWCVIC